MVPKPQTKVLTCRQRTSFPVTQPLVLPAVGHMCPFARDTEVGVQADGCLPPTLSGLPKPPRGFREAASESHDSLVPHANQPRVYWTLAVVPGEEHCFKKWSDSDAQLGR